LEFAAYLYIGETKSGLVVDEDAKSLGIPTYIHLQHLPTLKSGEPYKGMNIPSSSKYGERGTFKPYA